VSPRTRAASSATSLRRQRRTFRRGERRRRIGCGAPQFFDTDASAVDAIDEAAPSFAADAAEAADSGFACGDPAGFSDA
jgi:hypothetical protein